MAREIKFHALDIRSDLFSLLPSNNGRKVEITLKSNVCYFCELFLLFQGRFKETPAVLLTAKHSTLKRKRDAATLWTEDVTKTSFQICIRELQNFDGLHKDISVVGLT